MKANYRRIVGQITAGIIVLAGLVLANRATAQFTGDYQTNVLNGTAVNWSGNYYVGSNYVGNALFILNGGSLSNGWSYVGYQPGANNNLAVVSGNGSAWTNSFGFFYVGYAGSANRMVISDGGKVTSTLGVVTAGNSSGSISNSILITGSGSALTLLGDDLSGKLYVGDGGSYCDLVISNGGAALCYDGYVGGAGGKTNTGLVTGAGSVWQCGRTLYVGYSGGGNMLNVSNGGKVYCAQGIVGNQSNARFNSVLVTGVDSLWQSSGSLVIGNTASGSSSDCQLTIADGASVVASNAAVGNFASNCLIHLSGGHLMVTNVSETGLLDVRFASLRLDGGTVTADLLRLARSAQSILEFNSGTLHSKNTVISNTQPCVIGDAVGIANFHLLGGAHSFQDGLRIRTNSFLTGCGTVNGTVIIDPGGAVHANCTNLVFNSSITNNGTMVVDGAVLETFGAFVNNGKIFLLNGGTTNVHGSFINNGRILNGDIHLAIVHDGSGGLFIRFSGAPDVTYRLQRAESVTGPWPGIATNTAPASGLIEYHEFSPATGQSFYRTVQP